MLNHEISALEKEYLFSQLPAKKREGVAGLNACFI
jgi:hypothetical protein